SMLLKPRTFAPPKSRPPKRLVTLTIGSPSVFHTAPPQPASKARMICSPLFVGGAEASQKGVGLLFPGESIERAAILLYLKHSSTGDSSRARHCVHRPPR